MAQSKSGKSTYHASSSASRGKSSGSKGGAKSGSRSSSASSSRGSSSGRKPPSRRAQRRAQANNLGISLLLLGLGIVCIALVMVPGKNIWNAIRGGMFGIFGVTTYLLGPLLLYLAYLVASGYLVGSIVAKAALLGLLCASIPVVFSRFPTEGYDAWQTVKMLFAWGGSKFWAGGVAGVFGAILLALFGRPAANFLIVLVVLLGLMVFFAVTPVDVVQFAAYYIQTFRDKRAAAKEEDSAYDTPLFGNEPEEESIENLTGMQSVRHRAFDVERDSQRMAASTQQMPPVQPMAPVTPVQPVQPIQPVMPSMVDTQTIPRSKFDVDLGPDASTRGLQQAIRNDPLAPVNIGPGGTFGLDPLAQLSQKKRVQQTQAAAPQPTPEENFELHLDPDQQPPAQVSNEDEVEALIRRAMANVPTAQPETGEPSAETRLELPGEFATALPVNEPETYETNGLDEDEDAYIVPPEPQMTPAQNAAMNPTTDVIPTLGGSFDVASAAWNAGIPLSDVLSGRAVPPAPAVSPVAPQAPMSQPMPVVPAATPPMGAAMSGTAASFAPPPQGGEAARLRVDNTVGNSATPPVSSPPSAAKAAAQAEGVEVVQQVEVRPYCYPSLNLFNATRPHDEAGAEREMKKNAEILVGTLDSFGVKTRILDICRGPSVTRYELQPQAGIKVSRITGLADDIALNLATAGVRIEAPIPGKPAVGIEVPNKVRSTVNIRSVFEAQNYINMQSPLTMALGKDIAGCAQVGDLCKMPHLLIAGSTGSGKSVCVNSIIISFLFRSGPEDVKLLLIDPKVVELAEYNGIPHLLMPVVTEPRKAAGALGASVAEMERRYKLFAENNVRDIKSYNRLAKNSPVLEHLPYIAIVIDELADLMMVAGKEVEDYICRIAQKARAAGIHLIVATQRPSVDVITGLIKANIPSRIAFAVSSQIDSRTILDTGGAEKLLGNGDMLFLPVGAAKPTRVQGTFVTDEEISAVLNFIKSTSDAQYDEEMIAEMERRAVAEKGGKSSASDEDGGNALDPMFEQAVECVIEAGQASTSLLQRRCKLGYARAARIMDQMEREKIIGPYEGAKPRAVLVSQAQWQERKLNGQYEES